MRRFDEAAFVGQWWLPGRPGKQHHGTLRFGETHPELELYTVDAAHPLPGHDDDRFDAPVLHGQSMGVRLTLLDLTETASSTSRNMRTQESRRTLFVGTALLGHAHLQEGAGRFDRASFRLGNLTEWVNRTPYRWTSTGEAETVELLSLPLLDATIDGCEISVGRVSESRHGRLTESGFSSHEDVELRLRAPHSLQDIEYRYIRPLEQLLSLATGQDCRAFAIRVGNNDGTGKAMSGWPYDAYTVRRRTTDMTPPEKPMIRQHMRFGMNCPSYPPNVDFRDLVPRWFDVQAQSGAACDLVFSLRRDSAGYLQQQMFTIASALEGLHRSLHPGLEKKSPEDRTRSAEILEAIRTTRPEHHDWLKAAISYAHRKSYSYRMRDLLRQTGHAMDDIIGDEDKWIRRLRDIRDGIGHVLPSHDNTNVEPMVAMLFSARFLAEFVLLRQLGFTAAECRRAMGHNWGIDNVRSHMRKAFPDWFTA